MCIFNYEHLSSAAMHLLLIALSVCILVGQAVPVDPPRAGGEVENVNFLVKRIERELPVSLIHPADEIHLDPGILARETSIKPVAVKDRGEVIRSTLERVNRERDPISRLHILWGAQQGLKKGGMSGRNIFTAFEGRGFILSRL